MYSLVSKFDTLEEFAIRLDSKFVILEAFDARLDSNPVTLDAFDARLDCRFVILVELSERSVLKAIPVKVVPSPK